MKDQLVRMLLPGVALLTVAASSASAQYDEHFHRHNGYRRGFDGHHHAEPNGNGVNRLSPFVVYRNAHEDRCGDYEFDQYRHVEYGFDSPYRYGADVNVRNAHDGFAATERRASQRPCPGALILRCYLPPQTVAFACDRNSQLRSELGEGVDVSAIPRLGEFESLSRRKGSWNESAGTPFERVTPLPLGLNRDSANGDHASPNRIVSEGPPPMLLAPGESKLSPVDRAELSAQRVCPVTGDTLGSRGEPIKVAVGDRMVWVCSESCVAAVRANPNKNLPPTRVRGSASPKSPTQEPRGETHSHDHSSHSH